MKFKQITVKNYEHWVSNALYIVPEVNLLIDIDSTVTEETFNQGKDDYYISSIEIDRFTKMIDEDEIKLVGIYLDGRSTRI